MSALDREGPQPQPAEPTTHPGYDPHLGHDPHPGYDPHHPPDPALISDCVHCGFCLPTCPTYVLWGEEMDSPRGRIYQMDLVHEGAATLDDDALVGHIDACLGCMACVTACPSGVQYDKLLEAMRPQIERNYSRRWRDRAFRSAIFAVFPYPARIRAAAVFGLAYRRTGLSKLLGRVLPAKLRAAEALMPDVGLRALFARPPERVPAVGERRRTVAMLTGCVQRVFFGDVNAATARVLAAEGCDVLIPRAQGCCGALSEHVGREPEALDRARRTIAAFDAPELRAADTIVVNVAGCGSTMKEYGHLLRDDPDWAEPAKSFSAKVRDITEVLAELEPRAPRHPIPGHVAYHDACHLAHAQGVRLEPRRVLRTIPDLDLLDIPNGEICCGSAGVYNLLEPDAARELGTAKAASIASLTPRPDVVAAANPGCLLQIRTYLDRDVPLVHPVQLVDASIRGASLADLGSTP